MHVPRIETRTLDETVEALDLGQTPADIVFLSFSDSDLNALARAYDAFPEPKPSLRIASLAALRHPFSVDFIPGRDCAAVAAPEYTKCSLTATAAPPSSGGITAPIVPISYGTNNPRATPIPAST